MLASEPTTQNYMPPESTEHQNPHIFAVAESLKSLSDEKVKFFIANADLLTKELPILLGEAWPEILRIAKKTGEGGEKTEEATIGISVRFDCSNFDLLKTEIKFGVTPWKLNLKVEEERDLRQLELNFKTQTITITESDELTPQPGEDGETGKPKEDEVDLTTLSAAELKKIAKEKSIMHGSKITKADLIELIQKETKITGFPAAA
jgi:hypothetical protein